MLYGDIPLHQNNDSKNNINKTSNLTDSSLENSANNSEYFITIEGPQQCQHHDEFKISGQFKIHYEQSGISARSARVLKHIVLVVTRSGNYQALTPFKDVVVFEDDVKEEQGRCSGFFNVKVMDHIVFDGAGDYYVLCSLGTYLSNIIKISL